MNNIWSIHAVFDIGSPAFSTVDIFQILSYQHEGAIRPADEWNLRAVSSHLAG